MDSRYRRGGAYMLVSYQDWQALCASDPGQANAICREVMGDSIMVGPAKWEPITDRNHAAMMVEKVAQDGVTRIKFTIEVHDLISFESYGSAALAALMAPPSLIAYCACVALESRQSGAMNPVVIASCRNRAIDIVYGPEGDSLTCGQVRTLLEREYGADVCRAALGPEEAA